MIARDSVDYGVSDTDEESYIYEVSRNAALRSVNAGDWKEASHTFEDSPLLGKKNDDDQGKDVNEHAHLAPTEAQSKELFPSVMIMLLTMFFQSISLTIIVPSMLYFVEYVCQPQPCLSNSVIPEFDNCGSNSTILTCENTPSFQPSYCICSTNITKGSTLPPVGNYSDFTGACNATLLPFGQQSPDTLCNCTQSMILDPFCGRFGGVQPTQARAHSATPGTETVYALITMAFSVSMFFSSPLMGYWADRRPVREVMLWSIFISFAGNVYYAIAVILKYPSLHLILARLVCGIGSGNVGVARSYASEAASTKRKASYMALVAAAQGVGLVAGPILGGPVLAVVNNQHRVKYLNEYTAVGYAAAILLVFDFVIVALFLKENPYGKKKEAAKGEDGIKINQDGFEEFSFFKLRTWDMVEMRKIFVLLFCFLLVGGVFSVFETMVTALVQSAFPQKSGPELANITAILFVCGGVVSIIMYVVMSLPVYVKNINERVSLLAGLIINGIGMICLGQWPFIRADVVKLPIEQVVLGAIGFSVGFPMMSTAVYQLFSKGIHPLSQGTKMGALTAVGSFSRAVFPLLTTSAYNWRYGDPKYTFQRQYGDMMVFIGATGLDVLHILVLIVCWRWLVPYQKRKGKRVGGFEKI